MIKKKKRIYPIATGRVCPIVKNHSPWTIKFSYIKQNFPLLFHVKVVTYRGDSSLSLYHIHCGHSNKGSLLVSDENFPWVFQWATSFRIYSY